jgi:hypothetical protein
LYLTNPGIRIKYQQKNKAEQGERHSTAYTAKRQGGVRWCSQFLLSWFLQPTHIAAHGACFKAFTQKLSAPRAATHSTNKNPSRLRTGQAAKKTA